MGLPQGPELLVTVVILLLFGVLKLPEMARPLVRSAKEFRERIRAEVNHRGEIMSPPSAVTADDPELPERLVIPPAVWPHI